MNIISCLPDHIQNLLQQNLFLLKFIARYLPLRQWSFDDSHSPKYQKLKTDELPNIMPWPNTPQEWNWKDLLVYYKKRYGKDVKPIRRQSSCDIPDDCTCPRCHAPSEYLYKSNGDKGQILCKICNARFNPTDRTHASQIVCRCPHCGHTLVPKKQRKHFIVHKSTFPCLPARRGPGRAWEFGHMLP